MLADQPLITAAILRTIVQAHRQSFAPACVPVFAGRRGNPVLFDKALFRELKEMRGDTGGRELLDKYARAVVAVQKITPCCGILMRLKITKRKSKVRKLKSQESEASNQQSAVSCQLSGIRVQKPEA